MAPGGWALLAALLVPACCLQCEQCQGGGLCAPVPCAPHQQRCRSTLLSTTDASGRVLRREERGCAVPGVPDVTVTFLSRGRAVTLSEERCGGERCNRPRPPEPPPPPGPPRFCPSCSAADGSCERPPLALRCPRPGDVCLDLTTRLGGEEPGDDRIRGCGQAGPCRGLLGFESGHSLHVVRCCNGTHCGTEAEPPPSGLQCWACEGPAPHGCRPTALPCRGGLTHCVLADTYVRHRPRLPPPPPPPRPRRAPRVGGPGPTLETLDPQLEAQTYNWRPQTHNWRPQTQNWRPWTHNWIPRPTTGPPDLQLDPWTHNWRPQTHNWRPQTHNWTPPVAALPPSPLN